MEREIQVWWDVATLDFYVNNNIVPRGLRLFKKSTYKRHDLTLLKKWDQLLDKGSLLLMVFLINEKKKDLTQLDLEITELKASIRPLVENGEYTELLDKIERRVKDIESSIRENKRKKIMRDQNDYKTKTQRNWKRDIPRQRFNHLNTYETNYRLQPQRYLDRKETLISQRTPTQYSNGSNYNNRFGHNNQGQSRSYHHMQMRPKHQGRYQSQWNPDSRIPDQDSRTYQKRNWRPNDYSHQPITDTRTPVHDHTNVQTTAPTRDQQPASSQHMENDFLEKRGRIPPKKFAMEDFRSPDMRKKRTIRETEEEAEQQENPKKKKNPIQQKRRR
ncbi:Hypothetical predicted protein [Pelobates cultripes]|uniref:Uncharacterized protein n=1 Tax=Pelobates cultripes TaxID=61616 RepID=A0AAD1VLZ5_PELCU|nr:Hypothetical predicted protein [Pelobates cultripes]